MPPNSEDAKMAIGRTTKRNVVTKVFGFERMRETGFVWQRKEKKR